jgi:hypothetical protein
MLLIGRVTIKDRLLFSGFFKLFCLGYICTGLNGKPLSMRLGQLARKLAIRPSQIVEFLAAQNISLDESSNTRLEDDQVILIMKQFAPALGDTIAAREAADSPVVAEETPALNEATEAEDKSAEDLQTPSQVEESKAEVIKAPKVELSGLKVVGKIDLPELKKKDPTIAGIESPAENPGDAEKKGLPEGKKPSPYRREKPEQRPVRKNPIALQREREAQEAERKRQEKAKQEKEQRTKNYYNKVRAPAPTKRIKMLEDPTTEMSPAELKQAPRTWVGKFFNWLKT